MSADEHKAEGNEAIKAKDYAKAVECFTKAIALTPDNHVLYSNRSAAYTHLADYANAAKDARKCVEIKPDFAKGFSRLGTALQFQNKLKDAKEAYESGLKIEPTQQGCKDGVQQIEAAELRAASGTPSTPRTGSFFKQFAVVMCTLLYMFPFMPRQFSFVLYKIALGAAFSNYFSDLTAAHPLSFGLIKDSAKRNAMMRNDNAHYVFLCLILMVWPPLPFALVPLAVKALNRCLGGIKSRAQNLPGFIGRTINKQLAKLDQPIQPGANVTQGQIMIPAFAAISELMVGVMLIVSLVGGVMNLLIMVLYWQFLAWRYRSASEDGTWTKRAFWTMREKLDSIFQHKWCPGFIGGLWNRVKQFMAAYARSQA